MDGNKVPFVCVCVHIFFVIVLFVFFQQASVNLIESSNNLLKTTNNLYIPIELSFYS